MNYRANLDGFRGLIDFMLRDCCGGRPITAHWGIPDPAASTGSDAVIALAFKDAYRMLKRRIDLFVSCPYKYQFVTSAAVRLAIARPYLR
jgi:hypothetical protein